MVLLTKFHVDSSKIVDFFTCSQFLILSCFVGISLYIQNFLALELIVGLEFSFQLCFSVLRCGSKSPFWRRRSNCFSNFYSVLYYLIRKRRNIQNRRQYMSSMSVTSVGARGGHHHASDFIYAR